MRIGPRSAVACSLALAPLTPPALAYGQPPPRSGSEAPSAPRERVGSRNAWERSRTIRVVRGISHCLARDYPRVARAIVAFRLPDGDQAWLPLFREHQAEINRCALIATGWHHRVHRRIAWDMSGNLNLLTGSLAEALYRSRFPSLPILAAGAPSAISEIDDLPVRVTYLFANCLIDRDPAAVDRLLRSDVATDAESAAYAALSPHFPGCLDAGSRLGVDRYNLRAALADLLYRRSPTPD